MSGTNESCALSFQQGTSDKVYYLSLEQSGGGCKVVAQYGRRGSAMARDDKTKNGPVPYAEAKKLYDKVKREKIAKGYKESGATAPADQVADAPEGAPTFRVQELLTEIDEHAAAKLVLNDAYLMQDKSDGHSRGAVKHGGKIFGLNKLGKVVPLPAGIHDELARLPYDSFHICAELVGDILVCRDLIEGVVPEVAKRTYMERFNILCTALWDCSGPAFKRVVMVKTWEGSTRKVEALARQQAERFEGVVFKRADAPHAEGRAGQHFKFKFVKTLSAIAAKPGGTGKNSVDVGLRYNGGTVRIGSVSLIGKEKVKEGDVLEVAYLYASKGMMIQQPRMLRVRRDVTPDECVASQLIFKRGEEVES